MIPPPRFSLSSLEGDPVLDCEAGPPEGRLEWRLEAPDASGGGVWDRIVPGHGMAIATSLQAKLSQEVTLTGLDFPMLPLRGIFSRFHTNT